MGQSRGGCTGCRSKGGAQGWGICTADRGPQDSVPISSAPRSSEVGSTLPTLARSGRRIQPTRCHFQQHVAGIGRIWADVGQILAGPKLAELGQIWPTRTWFRPNVGRVRPIEARCRRRPNQGPWVGHERRGALVEHRSVVISSLSGVNCRGDQGASVYGVSSAGSQESQSTAGRHGAILRRVRLACFPRRRGPCRREVGGAGQSPAGPVKAAVACPPGDVFSC